MKDEIKFEEQIKELREKINQPDISSAEKLKSHGRLITAIKKEIKRCATNKQREIQLKVLLHEELVKHKEYIGQSKNKNESTKLPEKIALKIQEISTLINIFKEKHDITGKIKLSTQNTLASGLLISAITLGLGALGGSISLLSLASLIPTISYVGLSNLLRTFSRDTVVTKAIDYNEHKEEYQQAYKDEISRLKTDTRILELLKRKQQASSQMELMTINEQLIEAYSEFSSTLKSDEVKKICTAELMNNMKELKKIYEQLNEDYIKDRISLTGKEFAELTKKRLAVDVNLFINERYLKDATENALKNIGINTVTMYVSKLILSGIFPSLAINDMNDLITPFIYTVLNAAVSIPTYADNLNMKNTKYDGKKVKFNKKELFKDLATPKSVALA